MRFRSLGCLVLGLAVLMSAGCSKVKFYAVDRPRADQAITGNAGYIGGERKDAVSIDGRPTRRIYVFEVDRKKKEKAVLESIATQTVSESASVVEAKQETVNPPKRGLSLPYIGDDEPVSSDTGDTGAVNASTDAAGHFYTVIKDDTLQKISKKVYGSYSKWTKIYDANKDKIKNPNFVKPGIVIVIPEID